LPSNWGRKLDGANEKLERVARAHEANLAQARAQLSRFRLRIRRTESGRR
jgi:hypothetical protein